MPLGEPRRAPNRRSSAQLACAPRRARWCWGGKSVRVAENRSRRTKETITLELREGHWLIMAGETQRFWLHQVPKTTPAVGRRINLTFRRIIQAS